MSAPAASCGRTAVKSRPGPSCFPNGAGGAARLSGGADFGGTGADTPQAAPWSYRGSDAGRISVGFPDFGEVCALFSLTKRAKPHKINPLTTLMGRKAKRPAFREPAAAASRRGTFADDCSRSLLPEL